MKLVHLNSSIECFSAEVVSRKILPSSFIEIPNIGKCLTYKCSLNSEATILKEIYPKEPIKCNTSVLDLNSKLECDKLFVAVSKQKPYKFDLKNHTARHKAQVFITKEYTFAQITKTIHNIPPPAIQTL